MREQWQQLNEKWKNLPSPRRKLLIGCAILIYFVIVFACIPKIKIKTGYAKTPITIQTSTNPVRYEIADPIEIADNDDVNYDVYKSGTKIGTVKKTEIVFADTPEYEQAKKDRVAYDALKKQIEEKMQEERENALKQFEDSMDKVFYKVQLEPENYISHFYINPFTWQILQFDQKKQLFINCVNYTAAKFNLSEDKAKIMVQIKSSANEETLAEYSAFSGIKIK